MCYGFSWQCSVAFRGSVQGATHMRTHESGSFQVEATRCSTNYEGIQEGFMMPGTNSLLRNHHQHFLDRDRVASHLASLPQEAMITASSLKLYVQLPLAAYAVRMWHCKAVLLGML